MIVVGGTYTEVCVDPPSDPILGSGLRAAVLSRPRLDRFFTAFHPDERSRVAAVLGRPASTIVAADRPSPVRFVYETPMSRPAIYGLESPVPLIAEGDDALVFGMIDAAVRVRAERAVIDPQSSFTLTELSERISAPSKVIVANSREIRALAGTDNLTDAMRTVQTAATARAVVAKCGVSGCVVMTEHDDFDVLPARPTRSVWPIGSGDAFSAGFAASWFDHEDALRACAAGIDTAASVCSTGQLINGDPATIFELEATAIDVLQPGPTVYIAASFATVSQRWLLRLVTRAMRDVGIRPFSPLDENGLLDGDPSVIAEADLRGIEMCDAVLLLADGSRTGPWVEAGWATSRKRPIVVFTEGEVTDRFTMLVGTGAHVVNDLASAIYRSGWLGIAAREHRR